MEGSDRIGLLKHHHERNLIDDRGIKKDLHPVGALVGQHNIDEVVNSHREPTVHPRPPATAYFSSRLSHGPPV